jgi:hypothetical protein
VSGCAAGAGMGRCWLWHGHGFPRSDHPDGVALGKGDSVLGQRLETGPSAAAETGAEKDWASAETLAPGPGSPTRDGPGVGLVLTSFRLENGNLAARDKTKSSFALCCGTSSARASRLRAKRATSGGMALARVAQSRGRAQLVLAVHVACPHQTQPSRSACQASLDDQARLPGTQARTRFRL